ncbi:MAG: hypothetical protein R6U40_13370, partial [Desulfobacterales bacterium]
MIELAETGDAQREDTGCGILYGVLLDSAYKLKRLAEKEKENHIKKGWWKNGKELSSRDVSTVGPRTWPLRTRRI